VKNAGQFNVRTVTAMAGLREYIALLRQRGLLSVIDKETDLRFEVGEVCRSLRGRPVLFEKIKGFPHFRLFSNGCASNDLIGLGLGLEAGSPLSELIAVIKRGLATPRKAVMVESGPVQEIETAPDFGALPIPHWHHADKDRYLGTWHLNITKDPDTGIRNVGIYRMMVLSPTRATVSVSPNSHLMHHMLRAEKSGKALEMAIAIGVSEAFILAGAAALPEGVDEFELAGGLLGAPVELIKCHTADLEVPANSEIVIEGRILPGLRAHDGPYMDYAGVPNVNSRALVFEAARVMRRNDPIFRGTSVGIAGAEDHRLLAVLARLGLVNFHGSALRQTVLNFFLFHQLFTAFQWTGKTAQWSSSIKRRLFADR
jgi:UbiD family decarboxylase